MERVIGGIEDRVLSWYGRSLWFFLRQRWVSALIWVLCLAGTVYLFNIVPKAFLPIGDSSFIQGVFIAQEGSSPTQMHEYQAQVEEILQANPRGRRDGHAERLEWLVPGESGSGAGHPERSKRASARLERWPGS